jgi:hypothetical protein
MASLCTLRAWHCVWHRAQVLGIFVEGREGRKKRERKEEKEEWKKKRSWEEELRSFGDKCASRG